MFHPPGFIHPQLLNPVSKLCKALYCLKQALRAWYQAFKSFLLHYRFINSKSDTSLFIYNQGSILTYFLVYGDDLLLIGNEK